MKSLIYATIVVAALGLQACSSSKKAAKDSAAVNAKTEGPVTTEESAQAGKNAAKRGKVAKTLAGETKCTSGSDVRTIGVKDVGTGCEVIYTKMGESNSVASASSGSTHCVNVVTKIKDNLSNAGFTCE